MPSTKDDYYGPGDPDWDLLHGRTDPPPSFTADEYWEWNGYGD